MKHAISPGKAALRLIALPFALVSFVSVADEPPVSVEGSAPVEMLKASLPNSIGFKVDKLHMTDAGVACIKYRVGNDMEGESRALAVVEDGKVLRSTNGNAKFEKAWNSKCAGSKAAAK
jgi:hypothetical protein